MLIYKWFYMVWAWSHLYLLPFIWCLHISQAGGTQTHLPNLGLHPALIIAWLSPADQRDEIHPFWFSRRTCSADLSLQICPACLNWCGDATQRGVTALRIRFSSLSVYITDDFVLAFVSQTHRSKFSLKLLTLKVDPEKHYALWKTLPLVFFTFRSLR